MLFKLFSFTKITKIDIYVCIKNYCHWRNKAKYLKKKKKKHHVNDDALKLEFPTSE